MSEIKHTPEPWRWEINLKHKSVQIVGGHPMYDKTVMDFERWGLQGAAPRFNEKIAGDEFNVMTRLCDRPDWIAPFEGRHHHANWCANVTHPDARRIVACVNACAGIPTGFLESEQYLNTASFALRQKDEHQRNKLLAALANAESAIRELATDQDGDYELADELAAVIASVKGEVNQADQLSQTGSNPGQFKSRSDAVHVDGNFIFQGEGSAPGLDEARVSAATSGAHCSAPAVISHPAGSLGECVDLDDGGSRAGYGEDEA